MSPPYVTGVKSAQIDASREYFLAKPRPADALAWFVADATDRVSAARDEIDQFARTFGSITSVDELNARTLASRGFGEAAIRYAEAVLAECGDEDTAAVLRGRCDQCRVMFETAFAFWTPFRFPTAAENEEWKKSGIPVEYCLIEAEARLAP